MMLCRVRARLAQAEAALAESRRREVEARAALDGSGAWRRLPWRGSANFPLEDVAGSA